MSILDHLEELRDRIIYTALFLFLGCLIACFLSKSALGLLLRPFSQVELRRDEEVLPIRILEDGTMQIIPSAGVDTTSFTLTSPYRLYFYGPDSPYDPENPDFVFGFNNQKPVFFSPLDPVMLWLKTTIFLGLILALPFIAYQIWLFVSPGMKAKEKRTVVPILLLGSVLFPVGALFAYFAFGMILDFLLNLQIVNMEPMLNASLFLNVEVKLMIGFGVAFEMPIAIMFLTLMGIVDPPKLRKWRPYSILIIAFLSMMFTPPDPLSMIVMMLPLFVLYEFSILMSVPIARRKKEEEEAWEKEMAEQDAEDAAEAKKESEKKIAEAEAAGEDSTAPADSGFEEDEEDYYDGYDDYDQHEDTYYGQDSSSDKVDQKELDKKRWKKKQLRRKYREKKGNVVRRRGRSQK